MSLSTYFKPLASNKDHRRLVRNLCENLPFEITVDVGVELGVVLCLWHGASQYSDFGYGLKTFET
jgi:hypothetical protein